MDFAKKLEELAKALEEKERVKVEQRVMPKSPEFKEAYEILTKGNSYSSINPEAKDCIEAICNANGKTEEYLLKQLAVAGMIIKGYTCEDLNKRSKTGKYVATKVLGLAEGLVNYLNPEDKKAKDDMLLSIKTAREIITDPKVLEDATEEFFKDVLPELKKTLS